IDVDVGPHVHAEGRHPVNKRIAALLEYIACGVLAPFGGGNQERSRDARFSRPRRSDYERAGASIETAPQQTVECRYSGSKSGAIVHSAMLSRNQAREDAE